MQYPVTAPISGINQNLFPYYVDNKQFFKQYLKETPFYPIMGTELTKPIVVHTMKAGDGYQYRVPKLNALDYTKPVTDFNQVRGQAQTQSVDVDYVTCSEIAFSVIIKNAQLIKAGTPIDLPDQVNDQLRQACRLNLNKSILDAATFSNYNVATQISSYDRSMLAGLSPTRATWNAYANLQTAFNSFTAGNTAYNQQGLNARLLMNATIMASKGGKTNGAVYQNGVTIEDQIHPCRIMSKNGMPMQKYMAFFSPEALLTLYDDPLFQSTTTARGTVISSDQPEMISGADYVGEFKGVYIYQVDDLSRYNVYSADGNKNVSWGFLIGAASWSLGWYEQPSIEFDQDRIDRQQIWASHETRGQKCLRFPSKQASSVAAGIATVEQGLIHIFTNIPV